MAPALMDAFKSMSFARLTSAPLQPFVDLIRHGRNAKGHHHEEHQQPEPPAHDARGLRQQELPTVAPMSPPETKQAAEFIVKEERRQKSQMPFYEGLEAYELTDKMGELVSLLLLSWPRD